MQDKDVLAREYIITHLASVEAYHPIDLHNTDKVFRLDRIFAAAISGSSPAGSLWLETPAGRVLISNTYSVSNWNVYANMVPILIPSNTRLLLYIASTFGDAVMRVSVFGQFLPNEQV